MKLRPLALFGAIAALPLSSGAQPAVPNVPVTGAPPPHPIPLGDSRWLLDLEARTRAESQENMRDFDSSFDDEADDSFLVLRFRLGLSLQVTPWLRLYAQGQDGREIDSDRPNIPEVRGAQGTDDFDLRQALIEIADYQHFPLGLTVGRQRLNYGDRRLVADRNWNNLGRTFDAVKLRWQEPHWWLDAFAARVVQIRQGQINDGDAADHFFGLYGATDLLRWQTTELYLLYRDKADQQPDLDPTNRLDPEGGWTGPAQRTFTLGTRWQSRPGPTGPWDYQVELVFQWGDTWAADRSTPALDHRAFASSLTGGYTFTGPAWRPRLMLGYDFASGDRDPNDGRSESFRNLFPANHQHYGLIDVFSWRNMHGLRGGLNFTPAPHLDVEVQWHSFWLDESTDYWYRQNGLNLQRTRTAASQDVRTIGAGRFVGNELDFRVTWRPQPWFTLMAGYYHFFAADYVADTGPADDAHVTFVQAQITF